MPHSLPRPPQPTPAQPSTKHVLRLTRTEMRARCEHGLCFNCDDQYRPGHRFRQSHILLLLAEDEVLDLLPEFAEPTTHAPYLVEHPEHPIALHAISASK